MGVGLDEGDYVASIVPPKVFLASGFAASSIGFGNMALGLLSLLAALAIGILWIKVVHLVS